MVEQLVSFETAKLAKEKGFDWPVSKVWGWNTPFSATEAAQIDWNNYTIAFNLSAPTQSLLAKWLRDVHGIQIDLEFDHRPNEYIVSVGSIIDCPNYRKSYISNFIGRYPYFEEGMEAGLQEALKLIP